MTEKERKDFLEKFTEHGDDGLHWKDSAFPEVVLKYIIDNLYTESEVKNLINELMFN